MIFLASLLAAPAHAAANLTISPLTWNVIGLDSNNVNVGPENFPVGARVCNNGDATATNVTSQFFFDNGSISTDVYAGDAYINLRSGSLDQFTGSDAIASLPPNANPTVANGSCVDFYYEVNITRDSNAYDQTREFHIVANSNETGQVSSTTPRELYVEHLISQHRNGIYDVKLDGVSIVAGGTMNLVPGNTYNITLEGFTATNGYNQLETFINFPNTIFRINSVSTTYAVNTSPLVNNPDDELYANACDWDNDPASPTYRNCQEPYTLYKSGGDPTVVTYNLTILSSASGSGTLSSLYYDFSGSSYHYNADFATSTRNFIITQPNFPISKSFSPSSVYDNGTSTMTITLQNPTASTVTGWNFKDDFPNDMVVASPLSLTTSGCGTPTVRDYADAHALQAGDTGLYFSNGTLSGNSSCVIAVNVVVTNQTPYTNTTDNLFINSTDTGNNAQAVLTTLGSPPAGTGCPTALGTWLVPSTATNPPDTAGGNPTNGTGTAAASVPGSTGIDGTSGHNDSYSWNVYGFADANRLNNNLITFTINTTGNTTVTFSVWERNPNGAAGPDTLYLDYDAGAGFVGLQSFDMTNPPYNDSNWHEITITVAANNTGNTVFRFSADNANNNNSNAGVQLDEIHMTVTGGTCTPPEISKAFNPDTVADNGTDVSTLTITLKNDNVIDLTNATFTDVFPTGIEVASTPNDSTTCTGGTITSDGVNPLAGGDTQVQFTGGTIPSNSTCTIQVDVVATTAGPHLNVTSVLSTDESGPNPDSIGKATLTAIEPPTIDKVFVDNPIVAGATSLLRFTITNPNQDHSITGVEFGDNLPSVAGPFQMTALNSPAPTYSGCGAGVFSAFVDGATGVWFSGATIAAGGSCTITLTTTVPAGTPEGSVFNNLSDPVTHLINGQHVGTDNAAASLTTTAPTPAITFTKQIGTSATGPWFSYLNVPVGTPLYYRFIIENSGDVNLINTSSTEVTNPAPVNPAPCPFSDPLNVASVSFDGTTECVLGPIAAVAGTHANTAFATAQYSTRPSFNSRNSTATYDAIGPTAVNVTGFRGRVATDRNVLKWKTVSEAQIAGFNVYRQTGNGEWKQINANLKQAKHAGDALGDKYSFADRKVQTGKTYRYKVEVLYLDNHTEWTNVVRVKR